MDVKRIDFTDEVANILKNNNIDLPLDPAERYKAIKVGAGQIKGFYIDANRKECLGSNELSNQIYFYRAMTLSEASAWVTAWGHRNIGDIANSDISVLKNVLGPNNNGIYFASGENYSVEFLNNNKDRTVVLEFFAPGLVKSFDDIGVGRKGEGKGMSYGIGYQESCGDTKKEHNKMIDRLYGDIQGSKIDKTLREWWYEKALLDQYAKKRKILKVICFLENINNIRITYVRNV